MSASTQSLRVRGRPQRSVRQTLAAGIAVVLFSVAAFVMFGRATTPSAGNTVGATDVSVVDTRWAPKWAIASAQGGIGVGEPTMDVRWLPKQHLNAAWSSETG